MEINVNHALQDRLKDERVARGWTLDHFATLSGVSRAMISKIERGEVSPTAVILARLSTGLGISMSALFADAHADALCAEPAALQRKADQPLWQDPATGYIRRNVSPRSLGAAMEIVEVSLPARSHVMFDNAPPSLLAQFVWVLEGHLQMQVDAQAHDLAAGDCLHMRLDRPLVFHNPTDQPTRYAVVIETGARAR
jgi:transcriptional regulator with XRE-family HTH domain